MSSRSFASAAAVALLALASAESASALPATVAPVGFGSASSSSWLAGAVAGYNWQRGNVVFGFAGDLSWTGLKSETTGTFSSGIPAFVYPSADATARIDWYGTARARVGMVVGSFLIYGTGGVAFGNVKLNNTYNLGTLGDTFSIAPLSGQSSVVRGGWVGGFGADYMLTRNLVLNFEYQYVDLGTVDLPAMTAPAPLTGWSSNSASVHAQFQTVTIGLSYKFAPPARASAAYASTRVNTPPPPPANPWEGFYAGGRAGGAWGNNLNVSTPKALPPV
ncbi:outer membrane protein [Bradyrhizobium betae]|nr:outer membrane beta-barrel protein [Bradyrhizobium betae]MCS3727829.1 outer membrane immunogenic protein [Bradyrhizobium betae]